MVDTVRSLSALQAILADNTTGDISPQDLRDFLLSSIGTTGWAEYVDTQYSEGSPLAVAGDATAIVTNNKGTSREQEKPADITDWLTSTGAINAVVLGDGYVVTSECTIKQKTAQSTEVSFFYDIGEEGVAEIDLYNRVFTFNKGLNATRKITFTTAVFCLDTWQANTARLKATPSDDIEVYGIRTVLHRTHRGIGTYPPA